MQVTINSVTTSKHAKGYMIAEVKYSKDGKDENRKIMSFAAPTVYSILEGLKVFPVDANVTLVKSGNFWNWTGITIGASENNSESKPNVRVSSGSHSTGKVVGSNYETSEERARRQIYIIRQSSVSSAIDLLAARNPKGGEIPVEEVIQVAKLFESYVLAVSAPQVTTDTDTPV